MSTNRLKERLDKGPVICAEGFLFEIERRGYMASGEFQAAHSEAHDDHGVEKTGRGGQARHQGKPLGKTVGAVVELIEDLLHHEDAQKQHRIGKHHGQHRHAHHAEGKYLDQGGLKSLSAEGDALLWC